MQSFLGSLRRLAMLLMLTLGLSCGGDLDIPDQPLQGQINGADWNSTLANAFPVTTNGQFIARFLSSREPVSDPCTLPVPGLAHVKATFRPAIGDYSVAPFAIDDNQVQVAFELSSATSILAVSGSMSIFDINNATAVGYLQAEIDENNSVEGVFTMRICN